MKNIIDFTGFYDIDGCFRQYDPYDIAVMYISFSEKARREGLLALEDDLDLLGDGIMQMLLQMIVDGTDPELVRHIGTAYMEQNLSYLDGILQTMEYALLSDDDGPDDRFRLFCRSTTAASSEPLLAEAFTQFKSMVRSGRDSLDEDFPWRYREILTIAGTDTSPDEKAHMYQNHFSSILAYNNSLYQMFLIGSLAVQSGDNPRIVKDKLAGYIDPPLRGRLNEAIT